MNWTNIRDTLVAIIGLGVLLGGAYLISFERESLLIVFIVVIILTIGFGIKYNRQLSKEKANKYRTKAMSIIIITSIFLFGATPEMQIDGGKRWVEGFKTEQVLTENDEGGEYYDEVPVFPKTKLGKIWASMGKIIVIMGFTGCFVCYCLFKQKPSE